ncbi:P-loop NTPase fold protein [Amycolatopsis nalaikhensis]|uniref:P-loop NTPase fold protein n=1 Tax=Amycolatopsis nalaikhensis TaxID=715472 RepID=A0ABY8XEY1_9PSEU|nr:P-loop NTPase fold protein [Amycolatopsis sp. 2-2]WIV54172.1 P-loop NTPase fold protein [Amycolatopsis sp. 2-2]
MNEIRDPAGTISELIEESGRTPGRRVAEFAVTASAVQGERHASGGSATNRVTRSTALWVLLADEDIGPVLRRSGVDPQKFGALLGVSGVPRGRPVMEVITDEDLGLALRAHLGTLPREQRVVELVDIAIAIVRSARSGAGLPRRLREMRVSVDETLNNLHDFADASRRRARLVPLSSSMRAVAESLSGPLNAFDIVRAIAERHPEYAGGRLGSVRSLQRRGRHRTWEDWYESVSAWFDAETVAKSRHEMLNGRLFLLGLGLTAPEVLAALKAEGAWAPLATEIDEAVATPGSRLASVLDGIRFAPGYRNDGTRGADQLDVQGYVNALCEVVTDPAVTPPLSIGLFGKWGTGKSFFMEKMRERIAERVPESGDDEFSVVQIRFNAWHYADTSLWASLAIEIFERLADPEPVDPGQRLQWQRGRGDRHRKEREALLSELETYRDAKSTLDADLKRLEAERKQLVGRRKQAGEKRRDDIENAPLTDVAVELAKRPEVREELKKISGELGFEPAVDELTGLAKDLRTTAGYLPAVWRGIRHKSWLGTLAAAFAVLAVVTVALATRGGPAWLLSLAGSGGSLVVAARMAAPAARRVNTALGHLQTAIGIASEVREELRTRRSREERALDLKLADTEHVIAEKTQAITALDEKIAATRAAAETLTVGRKLYEFLNDRASGYQKHQGVVGGLHRDFRFLDALLRSRERSAEAGVRPVSRVVLYIDDLDRCPPSKVLEVLEAVHLLLALELFVVVVGVDPRWLSSSLWHQYRDLAADGDPRADAYLRGMPIEYLEKIFQIPFTLPAMKPAAFARLIGSVADVSEPITPVPVRPAATAAVEEPASEDERVPVAAGLDLEPGSAAAGGAGERIGLTKPEVEFAQGLGALVNSPRAAKRLMNTYRLIRSTRHVGPRSRFLGGDGRPGEFQAVLTLLAAVAGYPMLANFLLPALQQAADVRSWAEFVRRLAPATAGEEPGELFPTGLLAGSPEFAEWTRLHGALEASRQRGMLDDLESYRRWGPVIARFGFTF